MSIGFQGSGVARNLPPIFGGAGFEGILSRRVYAHRKHGLEDESALTNWQFEAAREDQEPEIAEDVQGVNGLVDFQRGQRLISRQLRRAPMSARRLQQRIVPVETDLNALRLEEQETEEPITLFAFATALAVLRIAYGELADAVPAPAIAPDSAGGIRIEWARERRNVRVVIPSQNTQRAYIYYRFNGKSAIDRLSGVKLAERLRDVILEF